MHCCLFRRQNDCFDDVIRSGATADMDPSVFQLETNGKFKMAASMAMRSIFSVCRIGCRLPVQWDVHPSGQVLIQQVRWKKNKAPHVAKEKEWTKQKKAVDLKSIKKSTYQNTREVVDDVWIRAHYAKPKRTALQAIEMHKEYAQPAMLNNMNGKIFAKMTLDFTTKKKTKFMKPFQELVSLPHPWDHGEIRKVLAFCKEPEDIAAAEKMGAVYAGGLELIKRIELGEILREEFHYVVATYDIAPDLVKIRSMIKELFPHKKNGTLGHNVKEMIQHFKNGHRYQVNKTALETEGTVEIELGNLMMTNEQLEENLKAFIDALCAHRSADLGPFIKEAYFLCPPSTENFLVDLSPYMPKSKKQIEDEHKLEDEEAEDSGDEAVAAQS